MRHSNRQVLQQLSLAAAGRLDPLASGIWATGVVAGHQLAHANPPFNSMTAQALSAAAEHAAASLPTEWISLYDSVRREIINTPETADFMAGVPIEAIHQRARWGSEHDDGKSPFDWFWLIGYLAQKAAHAAVNRDLEKAKHHTISTAAALANWHAALSGGDNAMRPGIMEPKT
jgi:hypothetical protein